MAIEMAATAVSKHLAAASAVGRIRRLWPSDVAAYRAHLLRLDSDARYSRFLAFMSDAVVAAHANSCFGADTSVFGFFVDGEIRGAVEMHQLTSPGGVRISEAETAFSIEKAWRRKGIGSALLDRVILAARNRGLQAVIVTCLPQNSAMQNLAKKFGAVLHSEPDEVSGKIKVALPTAQTILTEFVEESFDLATALLDLQGRIFPAAAPVRRAA